MSCSYCVGTHLGHCPPGSAHQKPISGTWSPIGQQSSIPGIFQSAVWHQAQRDTVKPGNPVLVSTPGQEVLDVSRLECHCLFTFIGMLHAAGLLIFLGLIFVYYFQRPAAAEPHTD